MLVLQEGTKVWCNLLLAIYPVFWCFSSLGGLFWPENKLIKLKKTQNKTLPPKKKPHQKTPPNPTQHKTFAWLAACLVQDCNWGNLNNINREGNKGKIKQKKAG